MIPKIINCAEFHFTQQWSKGWREWEIIQRLQTAVTQQAQNVSVDSRWGPEKEKVRLQLSGPKPASLCTVSRQHLLLQPALTKTIWDSPLSPSEMFILKVLSNSNIYSLTSVVRRKFCRKANILKKGKSLLTSEDTLNKGIIYNIYFLVSIHSHWSQSNLALS